MMRVTTSFLRGEVAASNHERKKLFPPWKHQEGNQKQNSRKDGSGTSRGQKGSKIDSRRKAVALNKGAQTEQWKGTAQGGKERRNLREGQSISHPNDEDEGTEGPMIIEAEIGGHCRMYVDGRSALEILSPSPYNGIIGRPGVRKLQAVPSTAHGMLKLPVEGGVITLKSSRLVPLECALVFGPEETLPATKPIVEERVKVAINPEYPEQTVMIGSTLTEEGRNKLCGLLQRNLDIFA
ncbi:hypothetical protein Tco_0527572 [Tanacetum coccineum]